MFRSSQGWFEPDDDEVAATSMRQGLHGAEGSSRHLLLNLPTAKYAADHIKESGGISRSGMDHEEVVLVWGDP